MFFLPGFSGISIPYFMQDFLTFDFNIFMSCLASECFSDAFAFFGAILDFAVAMIIPSCRRVYL